MNGKKNLKNQMTSSDWMKHAYEYWLDSSQRWILFMDILRKRGNNYFETIKKGAPPVLVFDYEVILEGRTFDRPVNYDLARIQPRKTDKIDPEKRPIIVIDPRAGNGPGIGGSKWDSEIGDALAHGTRSISSSFIQSPSRDRHWTMWKKPRSALSKKLPGFMQRLKSRR